MRTPPSSTYGAKPKFVPRMVTFMPPRVGMFTRGSVVLWFTAGWAKLTRVRSPTTGGPLGGMPPTSADRHVCPSTVNDMSMRRPPFEGRMVNAMCVWFQSASCSS